MTVIAGIVLAGGLSTRMGGQDKCLMQLGEQTLLQQTISRLSPQVDMIAVNTNSDAAEYEQTNLQILPDTFEGFAGPLAGVLTGMEWAADNGADYIATVAADTPFFPTDLVQVMRKALADQSGAIAIAETPAEDARFYNHPTFGLWPVALKDDLRDALENGVRKVIQWAKPHGVAKAAFSSDPFDPFFNVNRPEDFQKAQEFLKEYNL
ncbi:molybdenum cofactor guanylyltransferase MobA [Amylibacter sp. SFDW26]|uniref:molybdenum cofactor guanylyltransferase MobA n=1 Tax=Amylibacter sp. SFDW26 TaxID=2652722 RepID=UPI0012614931|nr:molybdenum cofactor guanylyltransferase MobA [Amylibacter sp. SFDW26]KAB7614765.1 molybdenum cofactor guanylyltransferase MobA [Amylibacter sp. SFDW26]